MDLGPEGTRSMLNRCTEPRNPPKWAWLSIKPCEFNLGKSDVFFVGEKVHILLLWYPFRFGVWKGSKNRTFWSEKVTSEWGIRLAEGQLGSDLISTAISEEWKWIRSTNSAPLCDSPCSSAMISNQYQNTTNLLLSESPNYLTGWVRILTHPCSKMNHVPVWISPRGVFWWPQIDETASVPTNLTPCIDKSVQEAGDLLQVPQVRLTADSK